MKKVSIYSLQSLIRRLSKTRKATQRNKVKIKEIEKQIYDIAVMQGKTFVATEYAKKITGSVKEAVKMVNKDLGTVLKQHRKYLPKLSPRKQFEKTLRENFTERTGKRIYQDKQFRGLETKSIDEIKSFVVENRMELLIGSPNTPAIFKLTSSEYGVAEELEKIRQLAMNDKDVMTNFNEVAKYTYEKLVYEKYYNPEGERIQDADYQADLDWFIDVAKDIRMAYQRVLKGKNIM